VLGIIPVTIEEFSNSKNNAILDASDAQMMEFAHNLSTVFGFLDIEPLSLLR
jgi:hypothetical protein